MSTTETPYPAILPQGVGYGIVIGVGLVFAVLMAGISYLQNRYTGFKTSNSEEFNTASRSVKPGLIASGICSAWTWAATLLQSCSVAYQYGVAGPFWYAAGATVQILVFAVLAVKVKQNAPNCHTFLEIIKVRYGTLAHVVFIFFALFTNILVASQLLLGGSAVVNALTGINTYASNFLIPIGVCIYVVLGGLRATFMADYSHTLILMAIIMYFMFTVYCTSDDIGSTSAMYRLLKVAQVERPVDKNTDGSYMTMKSNYGLIFGVIQICSGAGTVFADQGYWQRAIASKPRTAVRAYLLGGLAWFAIPFAFATTLGLAAVALTDSPAFPTYPNPLSSSQVSAGLAAPAAAQALAGKSGAAALLLVLFMAVTSSASSEMIATASILTFDVYKPYLSREKRPKNLILVSHLMIAFFALVMAIVASIWNVAGVDLGWLFLVMGVIINGAVVPVANTICWDKQTKLGAVAGSLSGLAGGLIAWFVTAQACYGEITISSTGTEYATLAGNLASMGVGGIVAVVLSLAFPDKEPFDWTITRVMNEEMVSDIIEGVVLAEADAENDLSSKGKEVMGVKPNNVERESSLEKLGSPPPESPANRDHYLAMARAAYDPNNLRGPFVFSVVASFSLTFIMDFLIPMPMFFAHYTFSEKFFTVWVVIGFLWTFLSTAITVFLPIVESRAFLFIMLKGMYKDLTGGKGRYAVDQ